MDSVHLEDGRLLVVDIAERESPAGHVVARMPLTMSDLKLSRDATWWQGVRKGKLKPDLHAYQLRVHPGPPTGGKVDGFEIELADREDAFRRHFPVTVLADVVKQKCLELVRDQVVSLGDSFHYYLTVVPAETSTSLPEPLSVTTHREPLRFEEAPLADFLAASQPLQGASESAELSEQRPMPIFATRDAWDEGRMHAFRGGENESAALFSGRLFRDTNSPEVFLCFEACLEARHAVESEFAVEFTGETWTHARQLLESRRRRLKRPGELFVASVHRHPFLPGTDGNGQRQCDACAQRERCTQTTAVPSADDLQFHRSVFVGQPWATLLIWGYTAREEEDFCLFGVQEARFQRRPMRLIEELPV